MQVIAWSLGAAWGGSLKHWKGTRLENSELQRSLWIWWLIHTGLWEVSAARARCLCHMVLQSRAVGLGWGLALAAECVSLMGEGDAALVISGSHTT